MYIQLQPFAGSETSPLSPDRKNQGKVTSAKSRLSPCYSSLLKKLSRPSPPWAVDYPLIKYMLSAQGPQYTTRSLNRDAYAISPTDVK